MVFAWYNPGVASNGSTQRLPVAVISDGKPGHENQSLGIAERLPDADILLMRHELRESFSEVWNRMRSGLILRISPEGARRLLGRVYGDSEIERLTSHQPKAIIAAGTLSAGPCLLAGTLTGAKTCVCMKPSMVPLSRFDLAVVPSHDNPPDSPNILRTLAAPNRVSPSFLDEESGKWADELPEGDSPVLSWIIGGPSSSAQFDGGHILSGLTATLEWARDKNWRVWLSTARRTPESLEDRIAQLAETHSALEWLLLWHRDRRNPLYAMFHRSKIAIVTSDSVSMIAEAASARCGPVVYQASEVAGVRKSKQDRMVDGLLETGYGERAGSAEELVDQLVKLIDEGKEFPILDDTGKAAGRLMQAICPP